MAIMQGYQRTDAHLIDYDMYELPGVERGFFRGPPVRGRDYVACVGAAQTFGRFVRQPFPQLMARSLGIESLNLGRGGAGPTYHSSNPALLDHINGARVVIVQVFSGRSQSNSAFRTIGHGMTGHRPATAAAMEAEDFYTWLLGQDRHYAQTIVAETRANYVADMTRLLAAITPPKILLWLSTRTPEYQETWQPPAWRLFGAFPQLVNREMVDALRPRADRYIECVSARGLPQPIVDREGNPSSFRARAAGQGEFVTKTENRYYPTPEMHEDAADRLIPACRTLLEA